MIYKVYAIRSLKDNRIYVGLTKNLNKRLEDHNKKRVFSTKGFCPWEIIYFEDCGESRIKAREREKYFKSGCGKEFLKNL